MVPTVVSYAEGEEEALVLNNKKTIIFLCIFEPSKKYHLKQIESGAIGT